MCYNYNLRKNLRILFAKFFITIILINYVCGANFTSELVSHSNREGRFYPFYTIGRFQNSVCQGTNTFQGTCVLKGECNTNGGVNTGSCSTVTSQAVCCVYQLSCGANTAFNNTYWYNTGYPGAYGGGSRCSIVVNPCSSGICQLRIDFLDFSLAQPSGDGSCQTDFLSVTGGSSRVPRICGENSGQHIYVDFNGVSPITIAVDTTGSVTFNRQWHLQIQQISCTSGFLAPSGCLQYYFDQTNTISSFNYGSSPNPQPNAIGVEGSRQLASTQYGICIRMAANMCSITYSQIGDPYSFTISGDVGAVDPALLGTAVVQETNCNTDYIIIPNPIQNNVLLLAGSDRFCGLGLVTTTSAVKPFVLYVVNNANENLDIGNRGFSLSYLQNQCPIA